MALVTLYYVVFCRCSFQFSCQNKKQCPIVMLGNPASYPGPTMTCISFILHLFKHK